MGAIVAVIWSCLENLLCRYTRGNFQWPSAADIGRTMQRLIGLVFRVYITLYTHLCIDIWKCF